MGWIVGSDGEGVGAQRGRRSGSYCTVLMLLDTERDERLKKAAQEAEAEIAAYREEREKLYQAELAKVRTAASIRKSRGAHDFPRCRTT